MGDSEALELTKRLERVERDVRRYRVVLAALGLVALAVLVVGVLTAGILKAARPAGASGTPGVIQALPDLTGQLTPLDAGASGTPALIQARKFQVVDGAGKVRGELGMVDDAPALMLRDKAGKVRATLAMVGDNVALVLLDKAGQVRADLGVFVDGVGLTLNDKAGQVRAALGNTDLKLGRTGSTEHRAVSSLVLSNEKGKVLWEAP